MRLAIFASGTGSNFQALVQAVKDGDMEASIALLVCDKPGAPVIEKAERAGIPVMVASPKSFSTKADYEASILEELQERDVELLVLAGYMRLIGKTLLDAFPSRILNIHPSLLPDFPGLHAIEKAYEAEVKETGVTVHLVDEGMDTGPILAQETLKRLPNETLEQLEFRIHALEHWLYPKSIQRYMVELASKKESC